MSKPLGRIAILWDKNQSLSPSNEKAICKFIESAKRHNYKAETITHREGNTLQEFDILFIRETTALDNFAYFMASKAENSGIPVIDDTHSIEICCDKAKQFRLFSDNKISIPKTMIIDKDNLMVPILKFSRPYIVKNPYGCFSNGVYKVDAPAEYQRFAIAMLEKLDKMIVQEFIQTDFDWRICVLNNKVLFACKYYMTPGHWKIIKHDKKGNFLDGEMCNIPIDAVPTPVYNAALSAAALVGNGLYGIDIKQTKHNIYVIEINDNPNIDAGNEDALDGDKIYNSIIQHLISQHQQRQLHQIQEF